MWSILSAKGHMCRAQYGRGARFKCCAIAVLKSSNAHAIISRVTSHTGG